MKFLDSLSGKKKSLILTLAGIIGLILIIFGTFGEKKEAKAPKGEEVFFSYQNPFFDVSSIPQWEKIWLNFCELRKEF